MCTISVVMPVYNGERYLSAAIESIINQTFKDWELIIVNDCSTDKSLQIIKKYADMDNRIHIITNNINMKLPASLNIGFDNTTGEYLTWTSDDNLYKSNAFKEMINYMNANPKCGMIAADYDLIDENGAFVKKINVLNANLKYYSTIGACFLYRKGVADDIGKYDTNMFLVEDYEYWLRIHKKYQINRLDKSLYKYRTHSNSLTNSRYSDVKKQLFKLRKKYKDFIFDDINNEKLTELFFDTYFYVDDKQDCVDFFLNYGLDEKYIEIVKRNRDIDNNKKYIIFGSGVIGKRAFDLLGNERVVFFADNNLKKIGTYIYEKKIISFDFLKKNKGNYNIVLAVTSMSGLVSLVNQMEENNIKNYVFLGEIISNDSR